MTKPFLFYRPAAFSLDFGDKERQVASWQFLCSYMVLI